VVVEFQIIFHTCKYPTQSVNGVLLGTIQKNEEPLIQVTDSIPLFHSHLTLIPMLEAAMHLIQEYCIQSQLQIIGYYHANELEADTDLNPIAIKIASKIQTQFSHALLLLLNSDQLSQFLLGSKKETDDNPAVFAFTRDDGDNWKKFNNSSKHKLILVGELRLHNLIHNAKWSTLIDFDNHFDDISKDWLNKKIFT